MHATGRELLFRRLLFQCYFKCQLEVVLVVGIFTERIVKGHEFLDLQLERDDRRVKEVIR
jgi:hypothetical protein